MTLYICLYTFSYPTEHKAVQTNTTPGEIENDESENDHLRSLQLQSKRDYDLHRGGIRDRQILGICEVSNNKQQTCKPGSAIINATKEGDIGTVERLL